MTGLGGEDGSCDGAGYFFCGGWGGRTVVVGPWEVEVGR